MTHDVTRPKPRIRYPTKIEKHRLDNFRAAVDKMAQEQNLAKKSVIDSVSFITQYERLMSIFGKCTSMIFGHNKPYCGNSGQSLTLGPIQHILSQIRNVCGAICLVNNPDSDVSINSTLLCNKSLCEFNRNPKGAEDIRSYLVQVCKKLYKDLYRERMDLVTVRAKDADKKKIAGTFLGGSTRRLMTVEEYIGLPTAMNILDGSGEG
jgi:hypothetical protein